jgi:hypothetical protein
VTRLEQLLSWWLRARRHRAYPPPVPAWSLVPDLVAEIWANPVGNVARERALMLWVDRAARLTLGWLLEQPDPGAAARDFRRPGSPAWLAWVRSGPWPAQWRGASGIGFDARVEFSACDDCGMQCAVENAADRTLTCLWCEKETPLCPLPF